MLKMALGKICVYSVVGVIREQLATIIDGALRYSLALCDFRPVEAIHPQSRPVMLD